MGPSMQTEQHELGRLGATYATPNSLVIGAMLLACASLLLLLTCIFIVRGFTLWHGTAPMTGGNSRLLIFLLMLIALLFSSVGVLVRLSLLCFRKQRLVVYVYDDGLVLLEGAAWGQKSRRVIRWDQITKVHVDIEVRDRVFYKAGYYKQWPPIRDEIPHYTFQLQDGSLIKLPEDVSEVESLFARIEAMIASHRHK